MRREWMQCRSRLFRRAALLPGWRRRRCGRRSGGRGGCSGGRRLRPCIRDEQTSGECGRGMRKRESGTSENRGNLHNPSVVKNQAICRWRSRLSPAACAMGRYCVKTSVALLSRGESVRRTGPRRSAGSTKLFYFMHFLHAASPSPRRRWCTIPAPKQALSRTQGGFRVNLIPMSGGAKL